MYQGTFVAEWVLLDDKGNKRKKQKETMYPRVVAMWANISPLLGLSFDLETGNYTELPKY